jgi:OPA family glycerol-3-phosphate transporter-like MFS transporter
MDERSRSLAQIASLIAVLIVSLGLSGPSWAQDDAPGLARPVVAADVDPAAATAAQDLPAAEPAAEVDQASPGAGQDAPAPEGADPTADEGAEAGAELDAAPQPLAAPQPGAQAPAAAAGQASDAHGAQTQAPEQEEHFLLAWGKKSAPIAILLIVIAIVIARLPKVEGVDHSKAYKLRRVMNWLPLGLTYAFLYMGRYNLKVSKHAFEEMASADGSALMGNEDFATIFGVGTIVYGFAFLINGPLTDRIGGRKAILIGAGGALLANFAMGLGAVSLLNQGLFYEQLASHFVIIYSVLYALNMYFQSFGAVSIVKVNAPWFHVRERGVFGAIFGILISLGIYFAFDWSGFILDGFATELDPHAGLPWVFFVPTIILSAFWVADFFLVADTPGAAGQVDFHTGDATAGDDSPRLPVIEVFKMMLRNPVIMTIAAVEFCSGFLRQAIMQWYGIFAKQTDGILGLRDTFVNENWGLLLCCAGILGGVVAGVISDHLFQSRRGPVATILYGFMAISAVVLVFTYDTSIVGWMMIAMSMAVIGVHGMLSGTASMDFGGAKNVGVAVGIIDGFVYLGTAVMSFTYGMILPQEELTEAHELVGAATDPANWLAWPISMIPLALLGTLLAMRLWNAKPKSKGGDKGKAPAGH